MASRHCLRQAEGPSCRLQHRRISMPALRARSACTASRRRTLYPCHLRMPTGNAARERRRLRRHQPRTRDPPNLGICARRSRAFSAPNPCKLPAGATNGHARVATASSHAPRPLAGWQTRSPAPGGARQRPCMAGGGACWRRFVQWAASRRLAPCGLRWQLQ